MKSDKPAETLWVQVCFSTDAYHMQHNGEAVVLVTDVLRATSAITTALAHGVAGIIPVETVEEARQYKERGYIVAAERDGQVLEFADFGNSPYYFMAPELKGKVLAYSTTNGTRAIHMAARAHQVVIGAFLNLTASVDYLRSLNRNVIILCAGWKGRFCLEDSVHAGAVVCELMKDHRYYTDCDSAKAALDLWETARKQGLESYIMKAAQKKRLERLGLDDVIPYCHTPDQTSMVPVFDKSSNRIKPAQLPEI